MKKLALTLMAFAPAFAFAQQLQGVESLVESIGRVVGLALPILVAIALLAFFWGLIKFIFAQGNEEAKGEGKQIMIWGLIALFVMVAVWGLVEWISTALDINTTKSVTPPSVDGV